MNVININPFALDVECDLYRATHISMLLTDLLKPNNCTKWSADTCSKYNPSFILPKTVSCQSQPTNIPFIYLTPYCFCVCLCVWYLPTVTCTHLTHRSMCWVFCRPEPLEASLRFPRLSVYLKNYPSGVNLAQCRRFAQVNERLASVTGVTSVTFP